jgi:hypothetical protein
VNVSTSRNGALTLVDDGTASATATITGVTGAQSGGTLSGTLSLPDPGDAVDDNNGHNSAFDASAGATISGTSNGVAIAHQLSFVWTSFCQTNVSGFAITGGDECAVRGGIAIGYGGETAGDYPGAGARNINTDGHFVTVTLTSLCGNGMVDAGVGETCDQGAANGTSSSCCLANCTIRPAGQTCRPSAGDCDVAETCDGSNPTCPMDGFAAPSVVCRAASSGMECDFSETCTGTGPSCPTDVPQPNGFVCRPAAGDCDLAEVCNGVSKLCPSDVKSMAVCRPQNGVCDVAESCNGGNNCPADGFANTMTPCRPAVDTCDVTENCPGNSPNCPGDQIKPSGAACPSDGNACTVDECDGVSTACQHPAGNTGAVCRPEAGLCDVAETCDGVSSTCPSDNVEPASTVCRAASPGELCDESELCDGVGTACPADEVKPAGTVCRSEGGDCDIAEECDGASTLCPADAFEPSSTECRGSAGGCDPAENCPGNAADCPADTLQPNGFPCRPAAGLCDVAETCNGISAACPADDLEDAGTPCRPATGVCDVAETCTGTGAACPADVFEPDGTSCADPLFCNGAETCMAGACQGGGAPCAMGQNCDESSDLCFSGGCPQNAVACRTAQKSMLIIKDKADDAKDKLIWKWIKGANTSQEEFGDPTTTANYALCFYSGPMASLVGGAEVPASGTKWSAIGAKGYKYKDTNGAEDGIRKVLVKGSTNNKSKALVKGKGALLPDFMLPVAPGDLPLIVQLRNNSSGICWEGSFATPIKNVPGLFKDKNP